MIRFLLPERTAESAYTIDYRAEYERGIRGIIFDIDNTLVPQDAPSDTRCADLVRELKSIGFGVALISNNKSTRVEPFALSVGADFVPDASKPSRKGFRKAMEILGTDLDTTLFVGDQLFTDILGARRAGVKTILVKPLDPSTDTGLIRFKRFFERIVLSGRKQK